MKVLVIDTALLALQVGVFDGATDVMLAAESLAEARGRSEALVPLVRAAMRAAQTEFSALGRIVVTVGPGSFTGLRVGIAAARGFSLALDIPVIGLSTLLGFAAPALSARFPGHVAAAIDARHDQVYFQLFSPDGRTVVAPAILPLDEAVRKIGGPPVLVAGDAALRVLERLKRAGVEDVVLDHRAAPDLLTLARLGLVADPVTVPARPLYLKGASADPLSRNPMVRA